MDYLKKPEKTAIYSFVKFDLDLKMPIHYQNHITQTILIKKTRLHQIIETKTLIL